MVSHLCSKNACPNKGDASKAIHLLRYLASTSDMGPVFKSSSTVLFAHADAAFGVHTDGFVVPHIFCRLVSQMPPLLQ